jgi:hypothetical protein
MQWQNTPTLLLDAVFRRKAQLRFSEGTEQDVARTFLGGTVDASATKSRKGRHSARGKQWQSFCQRPDWAKKDAGVFDFATIFVARTKT